MTMWVLLVEDVPKVGRAGEVKNVSDGYARNFLLARRLAKEATSAALAARQREAESRGAVQEKEKSEYQRLAEKLAGIALNFSLKLGEKGGAFGSVSEAKILNALAEHGIILQKEFLKLERPLKTLGEHEIKIEFPHNISGRIKVQIEKG